MSHYAQVIDGTVARVLVIEQDVVDSGLFGDPATWVQTSYNTRGGQHLQGGTPLRKNYAGIGYTFDLVRDAFYAPRPFPSWSLDEASCLWTPPTRMPTDGSIYRWDEASLSWIAAL